MTEPISPTGVSMRARLGGSRAISWQAVAIGDGLIIVLATILASASPGTRSSLEAAVDAFAITAATAIVVAIYTGAAHLTVFRNRRRKPLPIPVVIGFHLSIGVLFLLGFAVGAAALDVPPVGSSARFAVAVLAGGLMVCIPTALLLDHSDRYRDARFEYIRRIVDLERLRIGEWSLRRSLRSLVDRLEDARGAADLTERLDALDLSEDVNVSTTQLWDISRDHHQETTQSVAPLDSSKSPRHIDGEALTARLKGSVADRFPQVRWPQQFAAITSTSMRFPLSAGLLSIVAVWVSLTAFTPSSVAVPIAFTTAVGIYLAGTYLAGAKARRRISPMTVVLAIALWGGASAIAWSVLAWGPPTPSSLAVTGVAIATSVAAALSVVLVLWVSAVISARDDQLRSMEDLIDRRQAESSAVYSSLLAVVSKMAGMAPLDGSAAIAASATGLQRLQRGMGPQQARRVIEWTESVISAPGALPVASVEAQLEEVVHPWRALAEITIDCQGLARGSSRSSDVVAVVDEGVRNACRHGNADNIHVSVTVQHDDVIRVEIVDDGSGFGGEEPGMGFERFATLGTQGFEVTGRSPEAGTRVVVLMDSSVSGVG